MELELGFKITQTRADVTSTSNLLIAKDQAGPVFVSRETDTMFILTAHLKGFMRDNIEIKINEDGSRIIINGKKPVQEIVLRGWKVYKNDVEMKGFAKAFWIPDGVVLDKIKAKFSDDDSILTISMPKVVKGIRGLGVEEVSEEQEPETSADKVVPDDDDIKRVTEDEAQVIDGEIEEIADKESEVPKETAHVAEEEQKEEASQEMEQQEKQDMEERENQVKETLETQNQNQSGDVTAQDEEHSIPPEPKQEEPEAAQLPHTEETASEEKKIEGERDQTPQAMDDGVSNQEPAQHCEGEDKDNKEETHGEGSEMQQKCQKQESISDIQEPNQEETPTPTPVTPPADEHKDDETEEAEVDQLGHSEAEQEPQNAEEQNEIEQGNKNVMERCKLGVPIIIAGSAFLVSLFVYVVHSIRTKKRS